MHPWDAPLDDVEWREWLGRNEFGQLIADRLSERGAPMDAAAREHLLRRL